MQFPAKEGDVLILAGDLAAGLGNHAAMYPAPPIAPNALTDLLTTLNDTQADLVAAQGELETAAQMKLTVLGNLIAAMKKDIRYAETTVGNDQAKLALIGWGARKEPTPMPPPGTAIDLVATIQSETSVSFSWKKPADGGAVSAYIIERRVRPEGPWSVVATSLTTEATLTNQERKIEWEFRVKAANKNGEGMPSNTVMVVL